VPHPPIFTPDAVPATTTQFILAWDRHGGLVKIHLENDGGNGVFVYYKRVIVMHCRVTDSGVICLMRVRCVVLKLLS